MREPIFDYIKHTWTTLTRTHRSMAAAAVDPKFHPMADGRWPVYISAKEDPARIEQRLRQEMPPQDLGRIELRRLPAGEPGLLYLPHPYVVPGGRFNEMYGWDSYFIQVGLERDGLAELARQMAENFLYEIRNYGKILNANRSYYLTRSQPPFLTEMLLRVYQREHDRQWLADAMAAVEEYYRYWTRAPHLTPETGLSRYIDLGEGPAAEVLASERDRKGRTHYDRVKAFFRTHKVTDYDVRQFYDAGRDELTAEFYKGDRSMRESGFDPSDRFGLFSADIIHYNPVCLNSLLYRMEQQTGEILRVLDRAAEAAVWEQRAQERAAQMNRLLWDERDGLYYDYNFSRKDVRRYPYLTTFYPLWAGVASQEQAARVVGNLRLFERRGGLAASTHRSGDQWDYPFGWAPLEWLAVEGMRRYGFADDADRVASEFLSMVAEEYTRTGIIVEKYDVERRSSNVSGEIQFGYRTDEAGFGWTNAAFTALWDGLPPAKRPKLK